MTELLTEAEAVTLAEARRILDAVQGRVFKAAQESDSINAEHSGGYVAAKCDAARDAITTAAIAIHVHGGSAIAKAVYG